MLALTFFAFTTILGWNYYSEKCLEYLIGRRNERVITIYRIVYVLVVFAGPYLTVSAVWSIADICNGLMAIPNIIALILLSPMVACSTLEYFRNSKD
jgi:AGCS family alanine or glycine:cation symporter